MTLGTFVNRRWFLLQHAVQGWCPPLPVFRRLGVRTAREIHEEILALKAMRGDFDPAAGSAADALRSSQLR